MKNDSGSARAPRARSSCRPDARVARGSTKPVWNANVANGVDSSTSRSPVQWYSDTVTSSETITPDSRCSNDAFSAFFENAFSASALSAMDAFGTRGPLTTLRRRNSIGPRLSAASLSNRRGGDPSAPKLTPTSAPRQCTSAYGRNPSVASRGPFFFVGDARAEESVTRRRRAATFLREGASRRRRTTFATLIPSFETRVPNASIAATSHCAYRRCAAVASALPPERDDASNRRGFVGDAKYENPRRMADLADGGTKPPSIIRESPPSFEFLSRRSRPATHPGGAELTASSASAANSCSPA